MLRYQCFQQEESDIQCFKQEREDLLFACGGGKGVIEGVFGCVLEGAL